MGQEVAAPAGAGHSRSGRTPRFVGAKAAQLVSSPAQRLAGNSPHQSNMSHRGHFQPDPFGRSGC